MKRNDSLYDDKGTYIGFGTDSHLALDLIEEPDWSSSIVMKVIDRVPVLGIAAKVPTRFLTAIKNHVERRVDIHYENFIATMGVPLDVLYDDVPEDSGVVVMPVMITEIEIPGAKPMWAFVDVADMNEAGVLKELASSIRTRSDDTPFMMTFVDKRLRELAIPASDADEIYECIGEAIKAYKDAPWPADAAQEVVAGVSDERISRRMHTIDAFQSFINEIQGSDDEVE